MEEQTRYFGDNFRLFGTGQTSGIVKMLCIVSYFIKIISDFQSVKCQSNMKFSHNGQCQECEQ
jgi:hypothetical protein